MPPRRMPKVHRIGGWCRYAQMYDLVETTAISEVTCEECTQEILRWAPVFAASRREQLSLRGTLPYRGYDRKESA